MEKKFNFALLNVKKITCEHCKKEFAPWGFKNHINALNRKQNKNINI